VDLSRAKCEKKELSKELEKAFELEFDMSFVDTPAWILEKALSLEDTGK